jgi:mannose-6-phosphate isomerase-like protein (cupin superfamily)
MRVHLSLLLMTLWALTAAAQTANAPAAPKDRAVDFTDASLDADATDLIAKNLITKRVLEGGTFSINVRHIAGAETALSHRDITEVWVVREGSGIVATGGTLVNPEPGSGPGEQRGTGIRGGHERTIKAGDIIFIPPGVPHGIKESTSITYMNIRFQAKEPATAAR